MIIQDSSLVIRSAKIRDLHGVVELLSRSFHPPQGVLFWLYPIFKLGIYEDLRNRLTSDRPYYICLVATISQDALQQSEVIVGTVEIALRSTHSLGLLGVKYPYISNLAVSQAYRRQGIARRLLRRCEQIARDWGYQKLALHVLEDNYQAKQLYISQGYRIDRVEGDINNWLWQRPKKLLLVKEKF